MDEILWDALKQLRKQLADRESRPAYHIFTDDSLEDMVAQKTDHTRRFQSYPRCRTNQVGKIWPGICFSYPFRTEVAEVRGIKLAKRNTIFGVNSGGTNNIHCLFRHYSFL